MSKVRIDLMPNSLRLETFAEAEENKAKKAWKKLLFNICYSIAPKYWNRLWKEKQLLTQLMADGSIDAQRIQKDKDWTEWNEYSREQIKIIRNYLYNQVLANADIDEVTEFVNQYIDPDITKEQLVENAKLNYQKYQESLKDKQVTQYYDNYKDTDYQELKENAIDKKLVQDYPTLEITEESECIKKYDKHLSDPKYKNSQATIIGTNGEQIPCWLQLDTETKNRVVSVWYKGQFIQRRASDFKVQKSDRGILLLAKTKK